MLYNKVGIILPFGVYVHVSLVYSGAVGLTLLLFGIWPFFLRQGHENQLHSRVSFSVVQAVRFRV